MSSVNLNNLSIQELKKLVKEKNEDVKKLEEEKEKEKLILAYKKLQKKEEKLTQEKNEIKQKSKSKSKSKQKIKTFDEYFQECIENNNIPKDTPHYLQKALERAMKEYDKGIKHEKSALANFAEKYVIHGKPGLFPGDFFEEKSVQLKEFFRNHKNVKIRMIMVCLMEKEEVLDKLHSYKQKLAYFHSKTYTNLEETNEYDILEHMIEEILEGISTFVDEGTGWYFKEVISLEIHTVDYKPIKGFSYIPLPDFIMRKNVIINIKNEDDKCFLWSVLRYLHPKQIHGERLTDLIKYENDLNFKGIEFPVKVKDIQKFENQNPNLPGINVFPINDNNKIYPLRLNQKDAKKSIDLFLFSEDENQHYSLIKNFSRLARSQITSDRRKIHICKKCLTHFTKKYLFKRH